MRLSRANEWVSLYSTFAVNSSSRSLLSSWRSIASIRQPEQPTILVVVVCDAIGKLKGNLKWAEESKIIIARTFARSVHVFQSTSTSGILMSCKYSVAVQLFRYTIFRYTCRWWYQRIIDYHSFTRQPPPMINSPTVVLSAVVRRVTVSRETTSRRLSTGGAAAKHFRGARLKCSSSNKTRVAARVAHVSGGASGGLGGTPASDRSGALSSEVPLTARLPLCVALSTRFRQHFCALLCLRATIAFVTTVYSNLI